MKNVEICDLKNATKDFMIDIAKLAHPPMVLPQETLLRLGGNAENVRLYFEARVFGETMYKLVVEVTNQLDCFLFYYVEQMHVWKHLPVRNQNKIQNELNRLKPVIL
jgi:hypothetical protein